MDFLHDLIFTYAPYAHWIIFSALMLAGLNVPISEDLMIIFSAMLAATVVPENLALLFLFTFLGCYLSDWVSYWIGRIWGRKLWNIRWLSKTLKPERLEKIHTYYQKYGFWTLLLGRFIPFGVRNCLFLSAGMGKMPFRSFLLSDGVACLLSNSVLFSLAYTLGKNHESLLRNLRTVNLIFFSLFLVFLITLFWYKRSKKAA